MAAYLPIEVQRNGVFACQLEFTDPDEQPLDLTGATFVFRVKRAAGVAAVLTSAVVTVEDAALGLVNLLLDGRPLATLEGPMDEVVLAYDLVATQDNQPVPLLRGPIILLPGVS